MIRSISSKLRSTVEINVEHEMLNGYKKPLNAFFQFVYYLEEEIFKDQSNILDLSLEWQKRVFYNDKTKIRWNELKTLEQLELQSLTIKNINTRDQLKEILQKYNTKIASSSLDKNSKIRKSIRKWDKEIAQLLLIRPDIADPFQGDEILRQQVQFYMKRKFEEDILEDIQNQTQQSQIRLTSDNDQNELNLLLNVLSDQLRQGDKQLIQMKNNDSIQSIQLALASNRQKIFEIKLNSDMQFDELKQTKNEKAFINNFVTQICKNQKFNEKNVQVLGLEKGSIIIKFIVNDIVLNSTDIQEIYAKYDKNQIQIQVKPFFDKIGFSIDNFDFSRNEDWTSESDLLINFNSKKLKYQSKLNYKVNYKQITTGPDDNPLFTFPPKGWKAYGLNVDKYENNNWYNDIGEGAWYMVYGLIYDEDQENSIQRLSQIHPVSQVFETNVYNSIELAEKKCKISNRGQNQYKMIFQCRVLPGKLLVGSEPYKFAIHKDINEFKVDQIQNIRAEKILLKRMSDQCEKYTECFKNNCQLI
ncbi:hypothetical protein pb186bvf_008312 [Paramecium bursaria]